MDQWYFQPYFILHQILLAFLASVIDCFNHYVADDPDDDNDGIPDEDDDEDDEEGEL